MAKTFPLPANHVGSPCERRSFASGYARQSARSLVTAAASVLATGRTGWAELLDEGRFREGAMSVWINVETERKVNPADPVAHLVRLSVWEGPPTMLAGDVGPPLEQAATTPASAPASATMHRRDGCGRDRNAIRVLRAEGDRHSRGAPGPQCSRTLRASSQP